MGEKEDRFESIEILVYLISLIYALVFQYIAIM